MDSPDTRVGTTIGKYQIHEQIGRGGMGVVYRAEHVYIGKEVAVKVLHHTFGTRDDAVKRFLREARAASLINHPNIVDVTDFGKTNDGTVFFVMELLKGTPLDGLLMRERRLDLLRTISILNQLAGALGAAHAKGIVHRDLKPENIMLISRSGRRELLRDVHEPDGGLHTVTEREGEFDFVKILDFGVAKVMEPDANIKATQSGMVFGTPEYMAPETARIGSSDPRSDIYSLGIIFYEMLAGSVPFTGNSPIDVMLQHVSAAPVPPRTRAPDAEITEAAEAVIMKMIAKDADERYQTMDEVYRDLQSCYGSVRYRRYAAPERGGPPIPLTRVIKRAASGAASADPMTQRLTKDSPPPQPIAAAQAIGAAPQMGPPPARTNQASAPGGRPMREPVLLTKKKNAAPQTPPLGTPITPAAQAHTPPPQAPLAYAPPPRPTTPPPQPAFEYTPAPQPWAPPPQPALASPPPPQPWTPPPQPATAYARTMAPPQPAPPPAQPPAATRTVGSGADAWSLPSDYHDSPTTPPPQVTSSALLKTNSGQPSAAPTTPAPAAVGRPAPTGAVQRPAPAVRPADWDSAPATPAPVVRPPDWDDAPATPPPVLIAQPAQRPAAPTTPAPTAARPGATTPAPQPARKQTLRMQLSPPNPTPEPDGGDKTQG